ncbi:MAG: ATP-dependent 6-phosphofructokinase [Candidatus Aminicenantes bacterium]|nr:ATP-dependent 6-phosphofructokinase [Candidatus Aminicenantes bacterium]
MAEIKKIGIMTGGGDCPGLNAVIRAAAKRAIFECGWEVHGIVDGYEGLIRPRFRRLQASDVSGILTIGGTILGTSNTSDPYAYVDPLGSSKVKKDVSRRVLCNVREKGLDALILIGGDGTMSSAARLARAGLKIIGVPKTIDNDLRGTDVTFGFDTAVSVAAEAIDRLHTTAQSHHRIMVVEVMGRRAGWIALYAGTAGGGDIILIPEIPFTLETVAAKVNFRRKIGKRFSLVVIAEGARPRGGEVVVKKRIEGSPDPIRLGGVGFVLADQLERLTGQEARTVVLGHLQRGGSPTAADRILATQLGHEAVSLAVRGAFGRMVGIRSGKITSVTLDVPAKGQRLVPTDHPLITAARAVGTSFGDE